MFVLHAPFIDFLVRTEPAKFPNLAVVTASLIVREIVKINTHGLVSKHEHFQNLSMSCDLPLINQTT